MGDSKTKQCSTPSRRNFEDVESIPQSVEPPFRPSYLPATTSETKATASPSRYVQGIELISTRELPDRFRSIFHFPNFNAVQAKCFNTVFRTNDNFILAAPTGSGKTAIFELAICRLIHTYPSGQFKIVYQAPTKSLCAERQRDWDRKFSSFDMRCAELTGDTDQSQMKNVQSSSIIITTPEKWDSVTRKWKDHAKLMKLVKLFLIDEVHVLKEERGATLEAVVSRMKSVGSDVRFLALSATVPNSEDIAEWLGKDPFNQHLPAPRERFGEEFRPVLLQKHVCGYVSNGNDWAFNKTLDNKLPDVIAKYSQKKPIMVFCCTRKDTVSTARSLANWWSTKTPRERYWEAPLHQTRVADNYLEFCISAAVAFHHAGLPLSDREAVENGFLTGNINVICCTSTLAVGVNLPCHFVIIKNTVTYTDKGLKEYSDLEVMQMLGRAGRPQFDKSAVAVIMTRQEKVRRYEVMMSGQEVLESRLHQNLIDHLNAEIGLGTIKDLSTAKKWLSGTFLCVRMKNYPEHYRLEGDSGGSDMDQRLEQICNRDISLLREFKLIEGERLLKSTDYGDAMARYCVQFETAKTFLSLPPRAKLSEILSTIAQAAEFKEIRFRSGEKQAYKDLNKSPMIKFPIHVNLELPAHKVSLIIQSQLGSVDLPTDEKNQHNVQYSVDVNIIFQHVHRLIRCIIDFLLCADDSVALRNALLLCRSIGGRCWDDSPLTLKQVEGIGPAAVRKLVKINIQSIEDMANSEAHKIEMALGRHPPFGMQMLQKLKTFPVLRVSVTIVGQMTVKVGEGATLNIRSEIGFMNEKPPETYRQRPIYLIFLAETSDCKKVHFARISARKVGSGQDIKFTVTVTDPAQSIICHVMCEDLAGTLRSASIKPSDIPSNAWPTSTGGGSGEVPIQRSQRIAAAMRARDGKRSEAKQRETSEDFAADSLEDEDFLQAAEGTGDLEFQHIDTLLGEDSNTRKNTAANSGKKRQQRAEENPIQEDWQPTRLPNGKWACNHKCKDKTSCKHLCCREGADKPPKPSKKEQKAREKNDETKNAQKQWKNKMKSLPQGQTQLNLPTTKKDRASTLLSSDSLQEVDLTQTQRPKSSVNSMHTNRPKELKSLERLHATVQHGRTPPRINLPKYGTQTHATVASSTEVGVYAQHINSGKDFSTDYGDSWPEESSITAFDRDNSARMDMPEALVDRDEEFGETDSLLDDAMVGLADSQILRASRVSMNYEAHSGYEFEKKDETVDDTAELYEPLSPPARSQALSIRDTKMKDVSGSSEPLPTMSQLLNEKRAPFTESSPLFTTIATPLKRKAETQELPRTLVGEAKKSKSLSDAQNDATRKVLVESQKDAEREEIAHEGNDETVEEIDLWILQEFGKYIDFI